MYYQSKSKELRQKAINLMYLIFLAFLFTYVPADFLDAVFVSGKGQDMLAKDAGKENVISSVYFLELLKSDQELYEKTKSQFLEIEDYSSEVTNNIEKLKLDLISIDGIDAYGYFNNGKKEKATAEMMLGTAQAKALYNQINNYKNFILDYIGFEHAEVIDNMIQSKQYIVKSDGSKNTFDEFYFSHTPLNVAITNFNYFKGSIERVKIYTYRILIKSLIDKNKSDLPLDVYQNFEKINVDQLTNAETLRDFFEKMSGQSNTVDQQDQAKKQSNMLVESVTDTIYPEGHPFKFQLHFDTAHTKNINITVRGPRDNRTFNASKPGPFVYLPISKGRYSILFNDGSKTITKSVRVIDIEPIIQNTKLSTIYIGIDNPINIKTSEFGTDDQMVATITKGEIFRKGSNFYARVTEPGLVQVAIFAKMPYGIVKVAEQIFAVRSLNEPFAHINNYENGAIIPKEALKNFKQIKVVTDEYLLDEQFYIQDFTVAMVYNEHTQITKPFKNIGSSFNSFLMDLFAKAESGDKFIFTDIVAKSNMGTRIVLNPYNVSIK